ncbi:MAG: HEPN domain-containing protein [Endomicrobium sp.]|uniref:HEPN domain-containing protein n=1 Tax=Candidatus Endomicrobiellum cubanum TaxID=3242325 RepID=UPI0028222E5B|nr:HEPN domain-containing protein [Endomicrobium sp.]
MFVSHCQQAIEKYFKGFLIEHGWELQKTHNLKFLYKEILKIKDLSLDINFIIEIYRKYEKVDTRMITIPQEKKKQESITSSH